jgi:hypothetical protein
MKKLLKKINITNRDNISKSERLIYVIIFLWALYGVYGIFFNINLNQLAGYYAALTLFVSTYLWGEYKRTDQNTKLFTKGPNSSRELVIYITVFLWCLTGAVGIYLNYDLNSLTVYFSALSPFVISYIIYKTTKGYDLPIFDGKSQELIDKAKSETDMKPKSVVSIEIKKAVTELNKKEINMEEPLDNKPINTNIIDDNQDADV